MCNNDLYLGEHKVVMLKFLGQPSAASSTPIINHKNVNLSFRLAHLQQRIAPAFSHAQPGSARLGSAQLEFELGLGLGLEHGASGWPNNDHALCQTIFHAHKRLAVFGCSTSGLRTTRLHCKQYI